MWWQRVAWFAMASSRGVLRCGCDQGRWGLCTRRGAVGFSASPCFHPVTRPGTALQGAGGVGLGFCAWLRLYYQIVVFFL